MSAQKENFMYMPIEKTEFLAGLLWKELTEVIAESKRPEAVINHDRINQLQDLYLSVVKHRNKINSNK
jgi:hypothetical protein